MECPCPYGAFSTRKGTSLKIAWMLQGLVPETVGADTSSGGRLGHVPDTDGTGKERRRRTHT